MLGTWVVAIVSIIVGTTLYNKYKTSEYDEAATVYLAMALPEISRWDVETTKQLMAPEAIAKISEDRFIKTIDVFAKMGELKSLDTPKFSEIHSKTVAGGEQKTLVEYKVNAHYANGNALITINLLHEEGNFQVYHFNLSSEVLSQ